MKTHILLNSSSNEKCFRQKLERISKHFFFSENRAVYEVMWDNMVQPHRQQLTIQYGAEKVRFACRVTKARTQKHTLYLVLLVLPWQ